MPGIAFSGSSSRLGTILRYDASDEGYGNFKITEGEAPYKSFSSCRSTEFHADKA